MILSVCWLLFSICAAVAAEMLVARGAAAVALSYAPLSGDQTDSVTYQRSQLTPGEPALRAVWAGTAAAGALFWAAATFDMGWFYLLGLLAWLAALAWDAWTWERAAASVKFVSWRRGWQHSTRRVPVAQVSEVHVVEKPSALNFGLFKLRYAACYVALQMSDGKAIKLPRTATLGDLNRVEDYANFVRLQMQMVDDTRKRVAAEKRAEARRAGLPDPDAERELRKRLAELRQAGAKSDE